MRLSVIYKIATASVGRSEQRLSGWFQDPWMLLSRNLTFEGEDAIRFADSVS